MTHIEILRMKLNMAGWRNQSHTIEGWWQKLINQDDLTFADNDVLDHINLLETANIDMETVV